MEPDARLASESWSMTTGPGRGGPVTPLANSPSSLALPRGP